MRSLSHGRHRRQSTFQQARSTARRARGTARLDIDLRIYDAARAGVGRSAGLDVRASLGVAVLFGSAAIQYDDASGGHGGAEVEDLTFLPYRR